MTCATVTAGGGATAAADWAREWLQAASKVEQITAKIE
jgi:hypothetical protein